MSDRKQAVKLFASEIPGALPLQRHFFDKLQTAEWLPHLAKQGLFGEPLAGPDEGASGGIDGGGGGAGGEDTAEGGDRDRESESGGKG